LECRRELNRSLLQIRGELILPPCVVCRSCCRRVDDLVFPVEALLTALERLHPRRPRARRDGQGKFETQSPAVAAKGHRVVPRVTRADPPSGDTEPPFSGLLLSE
jgi:hypothetical protein